MQQNEFYFFLEWSSFLFIFWSFQTNNNFLQQINVKNVMPVQLRYSNPQPLEHESSPMTTRPGLPPYYGRNFFGLDFSALN